MTRVGGSLFGHLLAWCLGALALLWLSFVAAGYQTGRHETDELVDGHLASVAALLATGGHWQPGALGRPAEANLPAQHDYQQAMSLVVWDADGRLLAHQGTAPLPAFARDEGFATLQLGSPPQAWRSFARWSAGMPARRVMVLVNEAERTELGWDIAGQVAAPGLWLLPALALGLGLALRRGLRPLQALSDDVQSLHVDQGPGQGLHSPHPAAEFTAMVRAINTLVQRYHAALERERELASELAHELRTPLSALVLQARALREAPGGANATALQRLEQDALRAGQVLSELLALARASRDALAETAQPVDLGAVAQQVLAERAEAALAGGHDLALLADAGFIVQGHALLLGLALGNLVDNALAHSDGPTLVEIQLDAAGGRLLVCNGPLPGAAAAVADAARPAPLGLGLGHRVVAKVAAIHGAQFAEVAAPAGWSRCYALRFQLAADGSDLRPGPADR